jgi:hypothetical protein
MPSPRAVLADITDRALDPKKPHSELNYSGHLRVPRPVAQSKVNFVDVAFEGTGSVVDAVTIVDNDNVILVGGSNVEQSTPTLPCTGDMDSALSDLMFDDVGEKVLVVDENVLHVSKTITEPVELKEITVDCQLPDTVPDVVIKEEVEEVVETEAPRKRSRRRDRV